MVARCRHGASKTGYAGASCNREDDSMTTFIGIDVSLASSAFCVLDEHGHILKEAQVASEPESFVRYLRSLPEPIEAIGLEAGPLSQWLHRGLAEAGIDTTLMETRRVKAVLKPMPVKTDRRAAEGIATRSRLGSSEEHTSELQS